MADDISAMVVCRFMLVRHVTAYSHQSGMTANASRQNNRLDNAIIKFVLRSMLWYNRESTLTCSNLNGIVPKSRRGESTVKLC